MGSTEELPSFSVCVCWHHRNSGSLYQKTVWHRCQPARLFTVQPVRKTPSDLKTWAHVLFNSSQLKVLTILLSTFSPDPSVNSSSQLWERLTTSVPGAGAQRWVSVPTDLICPPAIQQAQEVKWLSSNLLSWILSSAVTAERAGGASAADPHRQIRPLMWRRRGAGPPSTRLCFHFPKRAWIACCLVGPPDGASPEPRRRWRLNYPVAIAGDDDDDGYERGSNERVTLCENWRRR